MSTYSGASAQSGSAYLTASEISGLQHKLVSILDYLQTNRTRIRTEDFGQLNNHIRYAMTTLTNMSNILAVESADPYGKLHYGNASQGAATTVVYNKDGTTRVVSESSLKTTGDGWERQFDGGLLQRPPCFLAPPQTLTSLPKIKTASDWNRTKNL